MTYSADPYEWSDWEKIFSWWPVTVNEKKVWLKYYYVRTGIHRFATIGNMFTITKIELGTIFDVLKS